jgi:gliding motility-associated-like protein
LKKLIYILFIFFALPALAQPTVFQACFNFDTVSYLRRGCAPLTVKIKNCSKAIKNAQGNFSDPQYDWFDGKPNNNPTDSFHVYDTPGKYKVLQTIFPNQDTISRYIEVLDTPLPNFKIFICNNFEIRLQTLDNVYDKYVIDWADGSLNDTINGNSIVSHTSSAGTKNIGVTGFYLRSCSSTKVFSSVDPIPNLVKPDIINLVVNRQANSNGQITLTLNAVQGQKYYLQQSTGSNAAYATIATIPIAASSGPVSFPINNLNTLSTQYCFRFRSYDDCAHDSTSEEICSNIISATPQNNQNSVSWSPFMGSSFGKYTLSGTSTGVISPASSPYIDNSVICGSNYTYKVITDLTTLTAAGNPIQSISDDSTIKAISTVIPPAIQNLNSNVTGNSVNLTWDVPAFIPAPTQYEILRSVNNGAYTAYSTSFSNNYTDNGANVNANIYCYMVNYTPCAVTSTSGSSSCTSSLQGDEVGGINLYWSPYSCTSGSADYTVEILDPNTNAVISSINVSSATSYTDAAADPNAPVLKYRIKITCGITSYYSNIFEINHELKIFLPSAFTPGNRDGTNDVFKPIGNYVKDFKMTIFNRWGEIVFYSDQFGVGWDGKYKGEIANMDAYAYMVEATDEFGHKLTRKGTVTLLR